MRELESELKELVISTLRLEEVKPEDIVSESPLFVEGLGLDSIDALEIGVALKKKYKVSLDIAEGDAAKKHFYSIKTLADFISTQQGRA